MFIRLSFLIGLFALTTSACAIARPAPTPTVTGQPQRVAPTATRAPAIPVPAWWSPELAVPQTAEVISASRDKIVWRARDTNADGIRDFFIREASAAGYTVTVIMKSQGAIYDLLFLKGQDVHALNITLGSDTTIPTGSRVGIFHLKVSGASNVELDLPLRYRLDITPGSEVSIGTSIPSPQCRECENFINIHIAPFMGAGVYDSKPGIYLIDLQVIPGGHPDRDDYRWAQNCVVVVKDAFGGTFDCRGLQNIADQTKTIDVSGAWRQ